MGLLNKLGIATAQQTERMSKRRKGAMPAIQKVVRIPVELQLWYERYHQLYPKESFQRFVVEAMIGRLQQYNIPLNVPPEHQRESKSLGFPHSIDPPIEDEE